MCESRNGIWGDEVVNKKLLQPALQISPNEANRPQSVCQTFLSGNVFHELLILRILDLEKCFHFEVVRGCARTMGKT